MYNISNGQMVADNNEVNVHSAVQIGEQLLASFSNSLPESFTSQSKKEVKTMQVLKKGLKQAIFVRFILIGQKRGIDLLQIFAHELCQVPASLIDDYGCLRKGNKAALVKRISVVSDCPLMPDVVLVDASQLLYHIV